MLPLAAAQAQPRFDPTARASPSPPIIYGMDYKSFCHGYAGRMCLEARDEEACQQGMRAGSRASTECMRRSVSSIRQRALAMPPLPPARNPLPGRWRVNSSGGLIDLCGGLFGKGSILEFTEREMFSTNASGRDSLGAVQHRMQSQRIYVLPDPRGVQFLEFDVQVTDRIREALLGDECTMVHHNGAPAAETVPGHSAAAKPSAPSMRPPPLRW